MTAYLLLGALAWAIAARGGSSARDLIVVLALLTAAVAAGRSWPREAPALWAAFTALICWLLIDGPLRTGWTLETIRIPLLVVIVALTALVVRQMHARERETFVTGFIAVGCLQAVIAIVEAAASIDASVATRASGLLGSPNGLGMFLVATSVLTAREFNRRGGWMPAAALLLQGFALLATGSRTAIAVGSVLLVGYVATHGGWKRRMLAAAGLTAGIAIMTWRTATEPLQDRTHLWLEALSRFAEQPLLGDGVSHAPFTSASPSARITTHAHNELLQWGVDYGLIGITLALVVLILAVRSVRDRITGDRWFQFATLAVLVAGLTDFTLRITALALTAGALATLALSGDQPVTASKADLSIRTVAR